MFLGPQQVAITLLHREYIKTSQPSQRMFPGHGATDNPNKTVFPDGFLRERERERERERGNFNITLQHVGSLFPNQGLNLGILHWRCKLLTTEPPGKSPSLYILFPPTRQEICTFSCGLRQRTRSVTRVFHSFWRSSNGLSSEGYWSHMCWRPGGGLERGTVRMVRVWPPGMWPLESQRPGENPMWLSCLHSLCCFVSRMLLLNNIRLPNSLGTTSSSDISNSILC